jgi:modified peptide precursor CbpA
MHSRIQIKNQEVILVKKVKASAKKVIASRRKCAAKGTGLSHYVLLDKK